MIDNVIFVDLLSNYKIPNMLIAIIKEGKVPSDSRVPLTPEQCRYIIDNTEHEVIVEASDVRAIQDHEYVDQGIPVVENVSKADIMLGVKEVPVAKLQEGKTYFFFSHTIKEQPYNQRLMRALIEKNIWMVDYEVLKNKKGNRVIAFGKYAGMVGAHNAIYTYGNRTELFDLERMKDCHSYKEVKQLYKKLKLPNIKIVLTGTGRVGNGAAEVLDDMGITRVNSEDFLSQTYNFPVYTQLKIRDYYARKDGAEFNKKHFYENPAMYKSIFSPYTKEADILIQGIYWDPEAPAFFTVDEMTKVEFKIEVIADITCDIAPESSIPSTLRPSNISRPIYGFNPRANSETTPFEKEHIDVMAIDNLPNELPRDASKAFGKMFIEHILPELDNLENSSMIIGATICKDGKLGPHFTYLEEYATTY